VRRRRQHAYPDANPDPNAHAMHREMYTDTKAAPYAGTAPVAALAELTRCIAQPFRNGLIPIIVTAFAFCSKAACAGRRNKQRAEILNKVFQPA
jgi:hypothetical protein